MRRDNWQLALAQEIERSRTMPFAYGANDCCQFVGRVALAITGANPLELFAQYSSVEQAAAIVAREGGYAAMLSKAFGEPKPVASAHKGDALLCDFGMGLQPAICDGVYCFAPAAGGMMHRRTDRAISAWSID